MAKFTIEKWRCDRCGAVADKWAKPVPMIEVSICVDYDVGPGPRMIWKELCSDCTTAVSKEFEIMRKSADAAKSAVKASAE